MLGLKLPTDPRWVNIVAKNIEEILTDHAYCEQKAASSAISLIIGFPEKTDLVQEMIALVQEEISHSKRYTTWSWNGDWLWEENAKTSMLSLWWSFSQRRKSGRSLAHKLLYAALIEARSCERFRLLSEELKTKASAFYRKLMISEANHYTTF